MKNKSVINRQNNYEKVQLPLPLLKELRAKGLVSIERLNVKNVKVMSLDHLKNGDNEQKSERKSESKELELNLKSKTDSQSDVESKKKEKKKSNKKEKQKEKSKPKSKSKSELESESILENKQMREKTEKKKRRKKRGAIEMTNTKEEKKEVERQSTKKRKTEVVKRGNDEKEEQQMNTRGKCEKEKSNKRLKKKKVEKKNVEKKNVEKKNVEKRNVGSKNVGTKNVGTKKTEKKCFNIKTFKKNEEKLQILKKKDFKEHIQKWTNKGKISIFYTIIKSLYDNQFLSPYAIQSKTMKESINRRKDIIVISKTGTGKTLTFCLPILNNILLDKLAEYDKKKKCISKLRFLILVPTRELALQIMNHFQLINKYTHIYIITIIGGICMRKQLRLINKKPEGIICTPGRLRFFLESEKPQSIDMEENEEQGYKYIQNMKHVRYFVCDELDKMVETSFTVNIKIITKYLYNCLEKRVTLLQTFLSSATLGLCAKIEQDKLANLINSINIRKEKSFLINLSETNTNENSQSILPEGLTLNVIKCEKKVTLMILFYFLKSYIFENAVTQEQREQQKEEQLEEKKKENMESNSNGVKKIIVFVNTIMSAKELKGLFSLLFFEPNIESNIPKKFKSNLFLKNKISLFCIHSKLEQKQRIESIDKFVQCKNHAIIFCTDVLSRGIDLHKCDLIVQLNCPVTDITFVHRSGRTARRFKHGLCVCFINEEEIANWKCSFNKLGLDLSEIKENENIKKLKGNEYHKLGQAFQICKEIQELQKHTKVEKKTFIDKLAIDAGLVDEDDSSSSASSYQEEDELNITSKNQVYKKIKYFKKKLYNMLYQKKKTY